MKQPTLTLLELSLAGVGPHPQVGRSHPQVVRSHPQVGPTTYTLIPRLVLLLAQPPGWYHF